jgi:hypothetical protein
MAVGHLGRMTKLLPMFSSTVVGLIGFETIGKFIVAVGVVTMEGQLQEAAPFM